MKKKLDIKKLVLLNLPYVFAFYFVNKLATVFRLAPGDDLIGKLTGGFANFGSAFANPLPSFNPIDLLIGVAAGALLKLAVYMKGKNRKKFRQGEEYGSARWGKPEDIRPYMDDDFSNNVILTQTEALTMNSRPKQPKYARNKNILVIGGSGSGKTRFFVKPNLMQMSEGKRCSGSIPYGYNRLPHDKQTLVVDKVASKVVHRIFTLASEGNNPPTIARILTEEKVLIPSAYTMQYHPEQCNFKAELGNTEWNSNTIREILNRQEYLGHTVLRKSIGINFKTDKRRESTDDEKLFFENTHEPIVSQELWNEAHSKLRHTVRRARNGENATESLFIGYLFCSECDSRLGAEVHYAKNDDKIFSYRCNKTYRKNDNCGSHYISEKALSQIVLHSIQRITAKIIEDEDAFCSMLQQKWKEKHNTQPKQSKKEINELQRRLDELDNFISNLYENYVKGILPEKQYKSLMKKYDDEQISIDKRLAELKEESKVTKVKSINVKKFVSIIKKYKNPDVLTRDLIVDLIDKIVVHEVVGKAPNREQKIDIYFRFIGQFELEYTKEEIEEIRLQAEKEKAEKYEKKKQRAKENGKKCRERKRKERLEANNGHLYAERICPQCGKAYYPANNRQIYCSPECKYEHDRGIILEKRFEEKGNHTFRQKECKICGKKFWPVNGQQVLCSEECRIKNRNQRQLEYYHNKQAEKKVSSSAGMKGA